MAARPSMGSVGCVVPILGWMNIDPSLLFSWKDLLPTQFSTRWTTHMLMDVVFGIRGCETLDAL